ncbi:histone H1, orphon-like [Drosophila innubila]|uniref:histone H1, orphon-like n=1 Tax=Drosophila innubila TaxID=198719 RepID=UPI00148DC1A7|nr:histone H1, orphon-like [Drosophila innubila]
MTPKEPTEKSAKPGDKKPEQKKAAAAAPAAAKKEASAAAKPAATAPKKAAAPAAKKPAAAAGAAKKSAAAAANKPDVKKTVTKPKAKTVTKTYHYLNKMLLLNLTVDKEPINLAKVPNDSLDDLQCAQEHKRLRKETST